MLLVVEKPVFQRMNAHVASHNAAQSKLGDTIRHGRLLTLNALVNMYCHDLREHLRSPMAIDSDELPPIYTNRRSLAKLTKAGTRTIYDHLEKLAEAGLIRKQFRGHTHDFTVWINPWIMLGDYFEPIPLVDLSAATHPGFKPRIRQSSPHKNTLKGINNYPNADVETVDKVGDHQERPVPPSPLSVRSDIGTLTLKRDATGTLETAAEGTFKGGRGGAANLPVSLPASQGNSSSGPVMASTDTGGNPASGATHLGNAKSTGRNSQDFVLEITKKLLTRAFWDVAREKLWPEQLFSEQHTKDILNLIWTDVLFGRMDCQTEKACNELYTDRVKQLEMIEKFGNRQKWASYMPPKCFFSYINYQEQVLKGQKGNFHHTTTWLIANYKAAAVVQSTRLIDQAISSVNNLRAPRKWTGEVTTIALYAYWKNKLQKEIDDPLLIDRFYVSVDAYTRQLKTAPTPEFSPQ